MDRAVEFFARRRRPFLFWTRDHLDEDLVDVLTARGFVPRPPPAGLAGVVVARRPDPYEVPPGCELRLVEDDAGYQDYLDIIAEVYQLADAPLPLRESILFSIDSVRTERMSVFVLYDGGRALSASANFVSGGAGGMQWTGTREEARGRGLGKITCGAAWASAFDRGAEMVVGQSSVMGTPVWLSMGFELVTRYRRFMSPPTVRR